MEQDGSERKKRTVQIPLTDAPWALLQFPFPMTEDEWNLMVTILDAMKPGLVPSVTQAPAPSP